ncbi:hypothetical protein D3C72_1893060 [compost metagenome]
MFLHTLGEPHAAEQAGAADRQVEQGGDASHGQRAGKGFQFVELSGKVAAADQGADRGAGDHADFDLGLVQGSQHADMGPAARGPAAERQGDLGLLRFFRFFHQWNADRRPVTSRLHRTRCRAVPHTPVQHIRTPLWLNNSQYIISALDVYQFV